MLIFLKVFCVSINTTCWTFIKNMVFMNYIPLKGNGKVKYLDFFNLFVIIK